MTMGEAFWLGVLCGTVLFGGFGCYVSYWYGTLTALARARRHIQHVLAAQAAREGDL